MPYGAMKRLFSTRPDNCGRKYFRRIARPGRGWQDQIVTALRYKPSWGFNQEPSLNSASNGRIALAFLAAPMAAALTLGFLVFVLWPLAGDDSTSPSRAAVHFALLGSIVIFPISIAAGFPLFLIFKRMGWLSRRVVFIGGGLLSLTYPAFISLSNPHIPGMVTPGHYVICAVCGAVAAWVFCAVSGLSSDHARGGIKPW